MTAGIVEDGQERLLIIQRPNRGLLGGLWKFPGGLIGPEETLEQGLIRRVREELGIGFEVQENLASVEHAYTHFRVTLHAFRCQWRTGKPKVLNCQDYQWSDPKDFSNFPFSKADRKIIALL
jgi:A/G-specific adenine glycosylase